MLGACFLRSTSTFFRFVFLFWILQLVGGLTGYGQLLVPDAGWSDFSGISGHPLGQGDHSSNTTDPDITATGGDLSVGATSDSGYFYHKAVGEGDDLRLRITSSQSSGVGGLMVRNDGSANAAFVFLGRKASSEADEIVIRFRKMAGDPIEERVIEATPFRSWFRIVIGRDRVYLYEAGNVNAHHPGTWSPLGMLPIDLSGGEPWEIKNDLAGIFLEDGEMDYGTLIQTSDLIWKELESDLTNAEVTGGWTTVSPSGGQESISGQLVSHPVQSSTPRSYVAFEMTTSTPSDYEAYLHLPSGNPTELTAEIWQAGQGITTSISAMPTENGWYYAGAAKLLAGDFEVRLYADGSTAGTVYADAATAVTRAATYSTAAYPHWVEVPASRVTGLNDGMSSNYVYKHKLGKNNRGNEVTRWDAAAYSAEVLVGDGEYFMRIADNEKIGSGGLSTTASGQSPGYVSYRFDQDVNGKVKPYIHGVGTHSPLNNTPSTIFWVRRVGEYISLWKGDQFMGHTTAGSTAQLFMRMAGYDKNFRVVGSGVRGRFVHYSRSNDLDADNALDKGDYETSFFESWVIDADPEDDIQSIYDVSGLAGEDDPDNDGLTNAQEWNLGETFDEPTNPTKPDTDSDGINDKEEIQPSANVPATDPTKRDSDGDGLTDKEEIAPDFLTSSDFQIDANVWVAFDPNDQDGDTDDDGVSDWVEWKILSVALTDSDSSNDFLHSQAAIDGTGDFDGDNVSDKDESDDGTDPTDPNDYFFPIYFGDSVTLGDFPERGGLGEFANAELSYIPNIDGVFRTRLERTFVSVPAGESSGGFSHHYLRDGSRIRFQFLDPSKDTSVGIVYHVLRETEPGDEPHYAVKIETTDGEATVVSAGESVLGDETFSLSGTDLIELRLDMEPGESQRLVIEKNFVEVASIPLAFIDLDTTPMVVAVSLKEQGSGVWNARHRLMDEPDIDGDGLRDTFEKEIYEHEDFPNLHSIYDIDVGDTDMDGLTNIEEQRYRTSGAERDTDNDGLWDGWEVRYGFDAIESNDAALDPDGDELTNLEEFQNRESYEGPDPEDLYSGSTHPNEEDTDGDGFRDDVETRLPERDPTMANEPADLDSDGDGLPDVWEALYGFDIEDPGDGARDSDYDSISNLEEFSHGTVPVGNWGLKPIDTTGSTIARDALAENPLLVARTLNALGQLCFVVIDAQNHVKLVKWGREGFSSEFDLGDAGDLSEVVNVKQNIFGGLVVVLEGDSNTGSAIWVWREGMPMHILDGGGNWNSVDDVFWTDSGFLVAAVTKSTGKEIVRWRDGNLETIFTGGSVDLIGVTEKGEVYDSIQGRFRQGVWVPPSSSGLLAVSRYGEELYGTGQQGGREFRQVGDLGDWVMGVYPPSIDVMGQDSPVVTDLTYFHYKNRELEGIFTGLGPWTFGDLTWDEIGQVDFDGDGFPDYAESYFDNLAADSGAPTYFSGFQDSFPGKGTDIYTTGFNNRGDVVGWFIKALDYGESETSGIFLSGGAVRTYSTGSIVSLLGEFDPNTQFETSRLLNLSDMGHVFVHADTLLTDADTGQQSEGDWWGMLVPSVDSDDDGIGDDWAAIHGVGDSDPIDLDELPSEIQFALGLFGSIEDTDGDALPDFWEVRNGLNPRSSDDPNYDYDGDGLTWYEEYLNGVDPYRTDSNDDGTTDDVGAIRYTVPDGDLLEPKFDPSGLDSDNDGLPDAFEDFYGPDASDPDADPDRDHLTNLEEFLFGRDPLDAIGWREVSLFNSGGIDFNDRDEAVVGNQTQVKTWRAGAWYSEMEASNPVDGVSLGNDGTVAVQVPDLQIEEEAELEIFTPFGTSSVSSKPKQSLLCVSDAGTVYFSRKQDVVENGITFPIELTKLLEFEKGGDYYSQIVPRFTYPASLMHTDRVVGPVGNGFCLHVSRSIDRIFESGSVSFDEAPVCYTELTKNGETIALGQAPGGGYFVGVDVNRNGTIVGIWLEPGLVNSGPSIPEPTYDETWESFPGKAMVWKEGQFIPLPFSPVYWVTVHGEFDTHDMKGGLSLQTVWLDIDDRDRVSAIVPSTDVSGDRSYVSIQKADDPTFPGEVGDLSSLQMAYDADLVSCALDENGYPVEDGNGDPVVEELAHYDISAIDPAVSDIPTWPEFKSSESGIIAERQSFTDIPPRIWFAGLSGPPVSGGVEKINKNGSLLYSSKMTVWRFPDQDFDGMSDDWEKVHGLNPRSSNDADEDADSDSISNYDEFWRYLDPQDPDSDNDTLPDGWEVKYGFDPREADDLTQDPNEDGLTIDVEAAYGLDPHTIDTDADNDGLSNYFEWLHNLDLADADDAGDDDDNDGLSNLREFRLNTNPDAIDSDADGVPDSLEVMYRPSDPTDENSFRDYGLHFTLESGETKAGTIEFPNTFAREMNLHLVFDSAGTELTDANGLPHEWISFGEVGTVPEEGTIVIPVWVSAGNVWTGPDLSIPLQLEDDLGNVILKTAVSMSVKPEIRASVSADLTTIQEGGLLPVQVTSLIPDQMTLAEVEVYVDGKLAGELQTTEADVTVAVPVYLEFGESFSITARAYGQFGDRGPLSSPLDAQVNVIADSVDQDNLPDYWEQALVEWDSEDEFDSIEDITEGGDFDRDGFTNLEEYDSGSHPADPDEDGNGVYDGYEDNLALWADTSDPSQLTLDLSSVTRWKSVDIQSHDFLSGAEAPTWTDQVFRTTAGAVEFHSDASMVASLAGSGISSSGDGYSVLGVIVPQLGTFDIAHPSTRTLLTIPDWFDLYIDNGALGIRERHDGAYLAGGVQELGSVIEQDEEGSFGLALTYEPVTRELKVWFEQLAYFDAATPYLTVTLSDLARDFAEIRIGSGTFGESAVDAKHGLWIVDPTIPDEERLGAFFEVAGKDWRYGLPRDPEIRLTAPERSGTYVAPARIKLAVEIIDADDPIDRVEFYDDGKLIGTDAEAPYEAVWSAKGIRTHAVTARAIDIGGRSGDSSPKYVILTEPEEDGEGDDEEGFEIPDYSSIFALLQSLQNSGNLPFNFNGPQSGSGGGNGGGGFNTDSGGFSGQTNQPDDMDGDGLVDSEDWVPYDRAIDQWDRTPVPRFLAIETGQFIPWKSNKFGMVLGYVGQQPDETAQWYVWYQGEWEANLIDATLHRVDANGDTEEFFPPELSEEFPVAYGTYVEPITPLSCNDEDDPEPVQAKFGWVFTPDNGFVKLDRAETSEQQTKLIEIRNIVSETEVEGIAFAVRKGTGCEDACILEESTNDTVISWETNGNANASWDFPEFDPESCDDNGTGGGPDICPYPPLSPISETERKRKKPDPAPGDPYTQTYGSDPIRRLTGEWVTSEDVDETQDEAYESYLTDAEEYNQRILDRESDEDEEPPCIRRPENPTPYSATAFVTGAEYEMNGAVEDAWEHNTQADATGLLNDPILMLEGDTPLIGVTQGNWKRGQNKTDQQGNTKDFEFEEGEFTETGHYLWMTHNGSELVPLRDGPEGNKIELGEFEPDRTMRVGDGGIDGLWANGIVYPWEELTGGYQIEEWADYRGNQDISCAKGHTAGGSTGGVLLIPYEYVAVDQMGNKTGLANDIVPSNPQPVIRVTGQPAVENLTRLADGTLTANITVTGEVISPALSMLESEDAKIKDIYTSLNGTDSSEPTPVTSLPKQSNGQRGPIRYHTVGTFTVNLPAVEVSEGRNVLDLHADDPVFHTMGHSIVTFEIEGSLPAEEQAVATIDFTDMPSDSEVDTLNVTIGTQFATLTETGNDTGEYIDNSGWIVSGDDLRGPFDPNSSDAVIASIFVPGNQEFTLSMSETSAGSLSFSATVSYIPPGDPTYSIDTIESDQLTSAGSLNPYYLWLNVGQWAESLSLTVGGSEVEFVAESGSQSTEVVATAAGLDDLPMPHIFAATSTEGANDYSYQEEKSKLVSKLSGFFDNTTDEVAFESGFLFGLGEGAVNIVVETSVLGHELAKIGFEVLTNDFAAFGAYIKYKFANTPEEEAEALLTFETYRQLQSQIFEDAYLQAEEQIKPVLAYATLWYQLAVAVANDNDENALSIWSELREKNALVAEVCLYAIETIMKEWDEADSFLKGRMMGLFVYEVAMFVIPQAEIAKASKVAKLESVMRNVTKRAGSPKGWSNVERLVTGMIQRLKKTKMCFVAGTLVMAQMGGATASVPIEQVSSYAEVDPAFRVWAKDEFTREEGWKRPLQYFTTHPDELFHLSFDVDGDGTSDETLTGTGEHPFWLPEEGVFVELREIEAGDVLYLANGASATVRENKRERAPPGESFTTYNFEVEDFHTYFVGEAGVWVHNFSSTFCEKFFAVAARAQDRLGITDPKGRRFEILEESLDDIVRDGQKIDSQTGNHFMHVTQYEEFAEYAGDLASIASVKQLRALKSRHSAGGFKHAGGFEIHHTAEKWMSDRLGIPDGVWDDAPGIPLRVKPNAEYDATYWDKFGHDPIYHGGTLEQGSLVQRLRQIRDRFDASQDPNRSAVMLQEVKTLYESPPYDTMNMWKVTRDWLKQHVSDPSIVPN